MTIFSHSVNCTRKKYLRNFDVICVNFLLCANKECKSAANRMRKMAVGMVYFLRNMIYFEILKT